MRLQPDVLQALEQGLLRPDEALEALRILLSEYSPTAILRMLDALSEPGALASLEEAEDLSELEELQEFAAPIRDTILTRVEQSGTRLLFADAKEAPLSAV
jgi:hypothetical protein